MIDEIILPKFRSRLDRDFFARAPRKVARELLGRVLVVEDDDGILYGRVSEVSAWAGKTDSTSDTASYHPGIAGVSVKYGNRLLDIATGRGAEPSCIMLVSALVDYESGAEMVKGPGNLTKTFDIDGSYDGRLIYDSNTFWIGGDGVDVRDILSRTKSSAPENCIGYFYVR